MGKRPQTPRLPKTFADASHPMFQPRLPCCTFARLQPSMHFCGRNFATDCEFSKSIQRVPLASFPFNTKYHSFATFLTFVRLSLANYEIPNLGNSQSHTKPGLKKCSTLLKLQVVASLFAQRFIRPGPIMIGCIITYCPRKKVAACAPRTQRKPSAASRGAALV